MTGRTWVPEVIVQVIDRVEARLEQPWPLDAIAEQARFSPFHFHRMFREVMGETPTGFVERLRLERAALLLLAADAPITDLAMAVGFRRPETFARRFHARFGTSAREYRCRQMRLWSEMGLDAGTDPLGKPGDIAIEHLPGLTMEVRRSIGEDEGFAFDAPGAVGRIGMTLDWPGITQPGQVRQDWGRLLNGRRLADGWVRRTIPGGLHASLSVTGAGPVPPTIHQRLFVWSMAGRYRLRPGPVLEFQRGDTITVHQPVSDEKGE